MLYTKPKHTHTQAHLLLLAHVAREPIHPALDKDLKLILERSPMFLAEMARLSCIPRPPHDAGWLTPCLASIEYIQCLVQAVAPGVRKPLMQSMCGGWVGGLWWVGGGWGGGGMSHVGCMQAVCACIKNQYIQKSSTDMMENNTHNVPQSTMHHTQHASSPTQHPTTTHRHWQGVC